MRDDLPQELRETLQRLPKQPGCYLYLSAEGRVLYVGKAKSLRSRVRSYFQPSAKHPPRIAALVAEVRKIELILAGSELEALVLESNLIKEHRPRYNVLLRDDKNFPYLKLDATSSFPRVVLVRRPRGDAATYFGPFLPTSHARRTLRMIPRFFQVANCHLPFDGRQRPCLYYHLDQCLAPCAGKADEGEYRERVEQVALFLGGRNEELSDTLHKLMFRASEGLEFERAARLRDMLASLEKLSARQQMSSIGLEDVDFWAEYREGDQAALELFQMRDGRIVGRREFTFDPAPEPALFYDTVLPQFYADENAPGEIVLPRLPARLDLLLDFLAPAAQPGKGRRVRLRAPTRGERRRFLDLVAKNAKLAFEARFRARHVHSVQRLEELRDLLSLDEAPYRIEGFDISHTQGQETRASMVVFEGGKAKPSDYRIYKIRSARAGDDYQALREVVTRRYRRVLSSGGRLPDLILIDGGKGQLGAAREALAELGLERLPAIGLAKREEEIFLERSGEALLLEEHNPALHLVQQLRDEAHRFAIKHHRKARSRSTITSELLQIDGIGKVTARRLLEQFGSVRGLRESPFESIAKAIGPSKARRIRDALKPSGNG